MITIIKNLKIKNQNENVKFKIIEFQILHFQLSFCILIFPF